MIVIYDNGDTVTIASSISSGNLLNITNDGDSKFCVAYDGSTTIQGNLSVHGDMHYIDTNVTVTSALSIINSGTGPALYVEQKGTEPIAHFIDKEGDDIIFDDNGRIGLGLFSASLFHSNILSPYSFKQLIQESKQFSRS